MTTKGDTMGRHTSKKTNIEPIYIEGKGMVDVNTGKPLPISQEVARELLVALIRVREAFYVKGDSKSLKAAFEGTKELVNEAMGGQ